MSTIKNIFFVILTITIFIPGTTKAAETLLPEGNFKHSIYGGTRNAKIIIQKDSDGQNYLSLNGFEKEVVAQAIASVSVQTAQQYKFDFQYKSTLLTFYITLYWKNSEGKPLGTHLVGANGENNEWTTWSKSPKKFVVFQLPQGKSINLEDKTIIVPEGATELVIILKIKGINSFDVKNVILDKLEPKD